MGRLDLEPNSTILKQNKSIVVVIRRSLRRKLRIEALRVQTLAAKPDPHRIRIEDSSLQNEMFYVNHKKRIYPQNSIHANFKTPVHLVFSNFTDQHRLRIVVGLGPRARRCLYNQVPWIFPPLERTAKSPSPVAGRDQISFSPPSPIRKRMGGFDLQVKERAKELKHLKGAVMKGVKVVGDSCKKAWNKVKSIKH